MKKTEKTLTNINGLKITLNRDDVLSILEQPLGTGIELMKGGKCLYLIVQEDFFELFDWLSEN